MTILNKVLEKLTINEEKLTAIQMLKSWINSKSVVTWNGGSGTFRYVTVNGKYIKNESDWNKYNKLATKLFHPCKVVTKTSQWNEVSPDPELYGDESKDIGVALLKPVDGLEFKIVRAVKTGRSNDVEVNLISNKAETQEERRLVVNVGFSSPTQALSKIHVPGSLDDKKKDEDVQMFALYSDGGNCFSSKSSDPRYQDWHWTASEYGETRREFTARAKRQAEDAAAYGYHYYVGGQGARTVKIFTDIEKFKAACQKVGMNPNLSEYE